tara:strand:+ start:113 stop:250 length:138 start_codon:yes stop_codon:yes gene_type:complete
VIKVFSINELLQTNEQNERWQKAYGEKGEYAFNSQLVLIRFVKYA